MPYAYQTAYNNDTFIPTKYMSLRLNNYLRSYRRKHGLNQREVAFLLGSEDGGQISRYEKGHRIPTLETALAFTTIFGVSAGVLFSDIQVKVDNEVLQRIAHLGTKIEKNIQEHRATVGGAHKLRWLNELSSSIDKHSSFHKP